MTSASAFRVKEYEPKSDWALPPKIRHFSASSLGMLQRCPEQYRQRYILGRKERPKVAMVLGSATHGAVEFNYRQKIDSGVDLPLKEVVDYFHDESVPKAIARDGGVEEIVWENESPDDIHARGDKMIRVYHENVVRTVQPVAVELEQRVPVPGVPIPMYGFVDCDTENVTIDLKTSARAVSNLKPAWRMQGRIYQLMRGKPVHWHVLTSAKEPKTITPLDAEGLLQPLAEKEQTEKLIRTLAWMLSDIYARFGPDEPWPMTGVAGDACSWCGMRKTCSAWDNYWEGPR